MVVLGQVAVKFRLLHGGFGWLCRAALEAEAVISGLEDMAVIGEPVEQGRGHLGVAEDGGPFGEAEIGGDDHAGTLMELAQQVEQQCAARGAISCVSRG